MDILIFLMENGAQSSGRKVNSDPAGGWSRNLCRGTFSPLSGCEESLSSFVELLSPLFCDDLGASREESAGQPGAGQ